MQDHHILKEYNGRSICADFNNDQCGEETHEDGGLTFCKHGVHICNWKDCHDSNQPDHMVTIKNLGRCNELNGQTGVVHKDVAVADGRVAIKLNEEVDGHDADFISVKHENIEDLPMVHSL
jgi:hypothetical protein